MQQLDPRAKILFSIQNILVLIPLVFFGFAIISDDGRSSLLETHPGTLLLICCLFLLLTIPVGIIWGLLTHYYYRYSLTEDGINIEKGVINKKYITIPYQRIQNVEIYRGILLRLLGISDLQIQTAGMSYTLNSKNNNRPVAEGRLPGIDKALAVQIQDQIVKQARLAGAGTQGL